jgi:hypothetical protein
MSKTFSIRVEKIINKPYGELRKILFSPENYPHWWKRFYAKHDSETNAIVFRPFFFIRIKLELQEKGDDFITFRYAEGPFTGHGTWLLSNIDAEKTLVSYTVFLQSRNMISGLIKSTGFFKWKHKRDIKSLLNKIERG